ncbi:metallophosphoesterase [Acidaminococcus intestini]|uniref:metallophosphoesterase n=3 Tax=Acidaminococcaceae TaxID=909930 RepID=UPI00307DE37D
MSINMFFLIVTALGLVGSTFSWGMYRTGFSLLHSAWTLLPFLLMPLIFAIGNIFTESLPVTLIRYFSWSGGVWMGFIFYSVLLSIFYGVCWLLGRFSQSPNLAPNAAITIFFIAFLGTGLGVYQALHPHVRRITLRTYKPLTRSMRIVFASDLHFGTLWGRRYGQKLVSRINAEDPDLVIFGGDLVDRSLSFVMREGSMDALRSLRAPMGLYSVMGNHDLMAGTGEQERTYLERMGIRFIVNESIPVSSSVWITGLDDERFGKKGYEAPAAQGSDLHIFAEHDEPYHVLEASQKEYDLYFAGHTHGGQFIPLNLITQRLFALDHGTQAFGNMLATVSTGHGLSVIPMRLGVPPEIVVVSVEPIKK